MKPLRAVNNQGRYLRKNGLANSAASRSAFLPASVSTWDDSCFRVFQEGNRPRYQLKHGYKLYRFPTTSREVAGFLNYGLHWFGE